jgi:hypothetical protein
VLTRDMRTITKETAPADLPAYTAPDVKDVLMKAGATGTVFALPIRETQEAFSFVVDGCTRSDLLGERGAGALLDEVRDENLFSIYHEPWFQSQDGAHVEYFDRWIGWAAPVMKFDPDAYPFRYPTAGASEGIFKIMSEFVASERAAGRTPSIHVFEGEYEGFTAFARSLAVEVTQHRRDRWAKTAEDMPDTGQFWISQPSAIDGMVWEPFADFLSSMAKARPGVEVIPDLSYVGAVARDYAVPIDSPNVPAFVISHSKPFGAYYHRIGGVFARTERPSLFGNKWFKNLLSLALGVEMMKRHGVYDIPRRLRTAQIEAAVRVGRNLGIERLEATDVMVMATAPVPSSPSSIERMLVRGGLKEKVIRICLTPAMAAAIDPQMASRTARMLAMSEHRARAIERLGEASA